VHFTDPAHRAWVAPWQRRLCWLARGKAALVAALLAGCSSPIPPYRPTPAPAQPGDAVRPAAPRENPPPAAPGAPTAKGMKPALVVGSWSAYRRQVAERLVAASPGATYAGRVPDVLLAIPVLEVELNADGSVRKVLVLRHPKQATDTTQLAIDAVHRAAPYGDVSRLPRPWKFSETFLFDDARRFKPRTLDD
jgi:hypothetical protein